MPGEPPSVVSRRRRRSENLEARCESQPPGLPAAGLLNGSPTRLPSIHPASQLVSQPTLASWRVSYFNVSALIVPPPQPSRRPLSSTLTRPAEN